MEETKQKMKRAWIQGNVISFIKPKYKSAFFDCEEVLVLKVKTETRLSDKTLKFISNLIS